ncbi:LysR substrate-binding domain-containing protein [Amphritea sp. 2_MG-2023]|jgi:DNA-binding transcriptional LysR family regulator|uniref:LysR family transcriptional regulator n=1 Tax=Amphritea TaxID=515417 RepID=UPI001C072133|nr:MULTISPECIES: LysR family transcriptional regulator [Amphritea]MBU2965271.1 LysR family transcriptional regulator [Amphritea atlantica]MDO6420133.1 LysR substrate-binding domain-containing protein [Amphritea sp. 2_MG-2023]MDX2421057.1 LysR substrate-binding domain-containing protein [Amphritea sp.]
MVKHVEPDQILVKMPSLRAVRSFVAAAKYQNFTRAAEALCVTQAAISRQIRELEASLGVSLFKRAGRAVELTEAGTILYDAAYLSFVNIAQAAQRIKNSDKRKQELIICCSPAFSAFWLSSRLPSFFADHPDIDVNIVTTNNFLQMEPGVHPDIFINKVSDPREGYHSIPLFYDLIYPVCSPLFLKQNPDIVTLDGLLNTTLLNLSPYGRSQIAEHVDWEVWLASQGVSIDVDDSDGRRHVFNANDYNMLIQMVLNHQGVSLGWNQLVKPMIEQGWLVRVGEFNTDYREKLHYLTYSESRKDNLAFRSFRDWFLEVIQAEETWVGE